MLGDEIVSRINQLGTISETPDHLTRIFLSPEHRTAADLLLSWMRDAGMAAHLDAIGNVCGRYEGERPGLPCLMLGSHYDTVRDAGKWDGPLGVITAIACVADLNRRGVRLPFAIEVVGFADEEGVRFASTLLGSRAVAGTFDESVLNARDRERPHHARGDGAIRARSRSYRCGGAGRRELHAYVELHIEQGPVLEQQNLPVGVVTAIAGATRLAANLTGMAGHAGTVPMALRRDALAGAAECIVAVEEFCKADGAGLVGTVGAITRDARRHQRDPGPCVVHPRHSRADGYAPQACGRRYRAADRSDREAARACRCRSTSPTKTAPCPARHG